MKKLILFIIVFSFTMSFPVFSQTGSVLIYSSNGLGIKKFESFKYDDYPEKQIFIQLQISYDPPLPNTTGSYYKLNRQTNNWYIPYNGFLNSKWSYDSWINGWRCNQVGDFTTFTGDTNYLMRHSTLILTDCCPTEENKYSFDAGNSMVTSIQIQPTFSNFCGFDFLSVDKIETYYYYGYNNSIYSVVNFFGIQQQDIMDNIPNLKRSINGGFVKVNPFNTNYLFTVSNNMMLSTTSGYNFFSINIPPVKKLIFSESDHKIYGFTLTKLYNSTDNGVSWDSLILPYNFNVIESNPDSSNVLYGGTDNGLYKSTNKGVSWNLYNNSFLTSRKVIGISKDKGPVGTLIVCTDFEVYKVWGSYIVDVNNISTNIPDKIILYQNYPNPFNPVTKIKFDITQDGRRKTQYVRLIVYDALGKEIKTLVNQNLSPGSYEAEFSGENLSSGMYFYKLVVSSSNPLEAGDFIETKRMLLIK